MSTEGNSTFDSIIINLISVSSVWTQIQLVRMMEYGDHNLIYPTLKLKYSWQNKPKLWLLVNKFVYMHADPLSHGDTILP